MLKKTRPAHDAFTFSLGGLRTVASLTAAVAIAEDRLNKARDERLSQLQEDQPENAREIAAIKGRYWLLRRRRIA